MRRLTRALVASITTLAVVPSAGLAHPRHHRLKLPADYRAWTRVATCESGGWRVLGAAYPDPLGITRTNYLAFGGRPLPPGPVSLRERITVIRVADRLVRHYRIGIPDQHGCAAW